MNLPKNIPIFPLSNFIIFPKTTVPLNIFEPRYVDMVNDSMKSNKFIGMVQPKGFNNKNVTEGDLYEVGCLGKITSFKEIADSKFLIELKGVIRFEIAKEISLGKKYRECEVSFEKYYDDLKDENEELKLSDLELIFKSLKDLFDKRGFVINWKQLEKQNLDETLNALAMASPFTMEEKQALLETKNLNSRKTKISEILKTYTFDTYNNNTLQ